MTMAWPIIVALAAALLVSTSQDRAVAQPTAFNIICNDTYAGTPPANSTTRIIQNVTPQIISICGWEVNAGAATVTWQLVYGTGSLCATGLTVLTPVFYLGINGIQVSRSPYAQISLPPGKDLCLVTTGTGPLEFFIYYAQF